MSTSTPCSRASHHACVRDWCNCPCHGEEIHHTPQGLLKHIVRASGEWVDHARCATIKHPDDWFPEAGSRRGTPVEANAWRPAKRVCAMCPVRRDCLTSALVSESSGLAAGVWGGLTPSERHDHRFKHLPLSERVDMLTLKFEAQIPLLTTNRERSEA